MTRENRLTRRGWNWSPVPADVILDKELSDFSTRLYSYLLWRAGNKGSAFPGAETIAKDFGVSVAKVLRGYRLLVKNDWIRRYRRYGRSSITCIFETKEECRSYQFSDDESIKNDMINVSNMIRLNESKVNESKSNAAKNAATPQPSSADEFFGTKRKTVQIAPPHSSAEAKERTAAALQRWAGGLTIEALRKLTGREISDNNKNVAKQIAFLREQGATIESVMSCMDYCQKVCNTGKDGKIWREHWIPDLDTIHTHYRASQAAPAARVIRPPQPKVIHAP